MAFDGKDKNASAEHETDTRKEWIPPTIAALKDGSVESGTIASPEIGFSPFAGLS